MAVDPLTALLSTGTAIINKIWPDAESKQKRIAELQKLAAAGDSEQLAAEVTLLSGQLEINREEAKNPNIFVSGWRPFIGWVGGVAMLYQFVVYPLLLWTLEDPAKAPPVLDTGVLFSMVTAMLGIGAMRSHDKAKGVDTKRHG